MNKSTTRSKFIDCLKAIAIILVVVGHAMQFGSGMHCYIYSDFFENVIFKIIYSFHMPLFMLISGYLFYGSVMRNTMADNIRSRFTTLLIPIMLWSIIPYVIRLVQGDERGVWLVVRAYFTTCIGNFWFLWAVFYCSLIVLAVRHCVGDRMFVYVLLAVVMLFTPDFNRLQLYKFMYGYFVVGYMLGKHNFIEKITCTKKKFCCIAAGLIIAYICLMFLFDRNCYIYTSGYTLLRDDVLRQLCIDIFRFATGLVGCAIVLILAILVRNVSRKICAGNNKSAANTFQKAMDILAYIGRNTLGIYIVSTLIFSYIVKPLAWKINGINYFLVVLEAVVVLAASLGITGQVRKIQVLGRLLLGRR